MNEILLNPTPPELARRIEQRAFRIEKLFTDRLELERTWSRGRGIYGWLTSTNHKDIGLRFIVTAFTFFALAGVLALLMRLQLARPQNTLLGPDLYNQFFTTHGTAMMFLFAVPVMEGFGLYFVPLMVGARNVAFPRLMTFAYWTYLFAGILLFAALFLNTGPDMGWFSYTPLSGPGYSPGKRVDVWSQMVTLVEIASMAGAVDIIVTALKLRAPGMALHRIPLFVWAQIISSFMVLFAMPAVTLCSTMLSMDRLTNVSTHFFNHAEGGDHLLWQHLFWFFGHPDVYIIFIPATGFVSAIIPAFCRRKMFAYTALLLSMVAVAFIGFGVWVHHMFATPIPELGQGMFTASSLLITIPNGVQIFCWTATIWGGKPWLKTPMLYVIGFLAIFILGGLTGVILASVQIDLQVHDTQFVVAHLHYVLIGGAVFPLLGAIHYWLPKWTGRMPSEKLGVLGFVLAFIGFNLTFFPLHQLGLKGMVRRQYWYPASSGWGDLNLLATFGAATLGLAFLVFLINVIRTTRHGLPAGSNPWGGGTLEWATTSPPPRYNFQRPPTVQGREPVWENRADTPVVAGLDTKTHETLRTTVMDAEPHHRYTMSGDALTPLLLAIVNAFMWIAGGIFHPAYFAIGCGLLIIPLTIWFWTSGERKEKAGESDQGGE